MFMQDNAAYQSAKRASEFLQQLGFSERRLMKQPACSPDSNPIENIYIVLKRQVYRDGRQLSSKDALWQAILDAARAIIAEQILSLMGSMGKRLRTIISNRGSYIIIIIKKEWQCKASRGRLTPYQSENPSPTLPTYRGKEEKRKIVEDKKGESNQANKKALNLLLETIEYGVSQIVPERY